MTPIEFENHPIFEKLEQLINKLAEQESKSKIELDNLNFYTAACRFINDRLKLTIPVLVPIAEFNTIANELENGLLQINSFLSNNNSEHLSNADTNFNTAIIRIRNLPLPFSKNDFNFSKAISGFEELLKSKLKVVESENKKLKEEISEIKASISTAKSDIKKVSELLLSKTNEINNLNSLFQTNFDNIKASSTQAFENDRKTFRNDISSDRESFKKQINQDLESFNEEAAELFKNIDNETKEILENIQTKLQEAKNLVNVIGNVGVTGNYQIIANQHKNTANLWRYLAIGFMTILSGLLIYTIWNVSSENYDWIKSVIRVFAAAVLSYPATYAARESSKHRKLETYNRKLELELASITPFIEMLSEDQKREIKTKLVEKYFGNQTYPIDSSEGKDEELSVSLLERILKTIGPFLKK